MDDSMDDSMDDKATLLDQLRIDRGEAAQRRNPVVWVIAAVILVILALGTWWWTRPTKIPFHVAVATAIGGSEAAPASVLDASGYVVARRQATVASKITGKLVELDIEEGDRIKAGQIIAKLDDTNMRAVLNQAGAQREYAKAGLAETHVNLANAERDYKRQTDLFEGHFVSRAAVDNAQTAMDALRAQLATQQTNVVVADRNVNIAERNLDDTVVRAPFAGVVTVKAAQPGEIVSPISAGGGFTRTGIGTIVDMESLEIQVDVNENFINRVKPAQSAQAKLNAYPDWQIPAHVIAVIPTADRSKGTVTVRIAIEQKDPRILPEMGVRVSFQAAAESRGQAAGDGQVASGGSSAPNAAVRLPLKAVKQASNAGTAPAAGEVFVIHDDKVERRAVRLGAISGADVVVQSGVTAGERVAVGDFAELKDGDTIRIEP